MLQHNNIYSPLAYIKLQLCLTKTEKPIVIDISQNHVSIFGRRPRGQSQPADGPLEIENIYFSR